MRSGRPPTLWCDLIVTLGQAADDLALLFRVVLAFQLADEHVAGVAVHQLDVKAVAEGLDHLLRLAHAQQTVVDENTGELIADGLVDQHRGDRRIDAAGQAADDLTVADLGPNLGDLFLAKIGHRPVAGAARDLVHEIAEQFAAVRCVDHFRMELHAVKWLALMRDHREGGAVGGCDRPKSLGNLDDLVAVAHPDLMLLAGLPDTLIERAFFRHIDKGASELAFGRLHHVTAQLRAHGHLAVADAEHR